MSNDNVRKFGVIYCYSQFLNMNEKRIERLIDRFGVEKVEKALENRNNDLRMGRFKNKNPYLEEWNKFEEWERKRQFG
ncbi:MAG: hypothetical protein ACP5KP_04365 [Candidatus Micrarchaeia archaeon]